MAFGAFLDQKVLKVAGFFVQLSRNPLVALRIAKDVGSVKVKERVVPSRRKEYERGLEEEIKRYPMEVPRFSLGASLLIVSLLLIFYLILYLVT
jgi:hypothetical protein